MFSVKSVIRTAGAIGTAAVLLASGAQAASAAPALTNGPGMSIWTQPGYGSLSVKASRVSGPQVTYACTLGPQSTILGGGFGNTGSPLQGYIDGFSLMYYGTCTSPSGGASLYVQQQRLNAEKSGAAFSLTSPISWKIRLTAGSTTIADTAAGPNVAWSVPWINGDGTGVNLSHLTFSNTLIGYSGANLTYQQMRVTGTLNVPNVILS